MDLLERFQISPATFAEGRSGMLGAMVDLHRAGLAPDEVLAVAWQSYDQRLAALDERNPRLAELAARPARETIEGAHRDLLEVLAIVRAGESAEVDELGRDRF